MNTNRRNSAKTAAQGLAQLPVGRAGPMPASIAAAFADHAVATLGQAVEFLSDIGADDAACNALGISTEDRDEAVTKLSTVLPVQASGQSRYSAIPGGVVLGEAPSSSEVDVPRLKSAEYGETRRKDKT